MFGGGGFLPSKLIPFHSTWGTLEEPAGSSKTALGQISRSVCTPIRPGRSLVARIAGKQHVSQFQCVWDDLIIRPKDGLKAPGGGAEMNKRT